MYILRSCRTEKYYVGSSMDLEIRLARHNGPDAGWTKRYQPWTVVCREEYETRGEAVMSCRKRERDGCSDSVCGSNSVGRVTAFQAVGRGFESRLPLHQS